MVIHGKGNFLYNVYKRDTKNDIMLAGQLRSPTKSLDTVVKLVNKFFGLRTRKQWEKVQLAGNAKNPVKKTTTKKDTYPMKNTKACKMAKVKKGVYSLHNTETGESYTLLK